MYYNPDFTKKIGKGYCGCVYQSVEKPYEIVIKVIDKKSKSKISNDIDRKYDNVFIKLTQNSIYLVSLFDVYNIEDMCCVSMEYMSGMDLLDYVLEYGSLSNLKNNNKNVKRIIKYVLEGLNYLHKNNVIHCDVKCENIRLLNNGGVKLFDYNLYCYDNQNKSIKCGTFGYMAPEIVFGLDNKLSKFRNRIDIWSLGQTLHVMMESRMLIPMNSKSYIRHLYALQYKKTFVDMLDKNIWDDILIKMFDSMVKIEPRMRKSADELLTMF